MSSVPSAISMPGDDRAGERQRPPGRPPGPSSERSGTRANATATSEQRDDRQRGSEGDLERESHPGILGRRSRELASATSATASATIAPASARSAPSLARTSSSAVIGSEVPSVRSMRPSTWTTRRRTSRTGVESVRCARLERYAKTAPAARDEVELSGRGEVRGEEREGAPGEREPGVAVEAPAEQLEVVGDDDERPDERRTRRSTGRP